MCAVTRRTRFMPSRKLGVLATMRTTVERRHATRLPAVARAVRPLEDTSFSRNVARLRPSPAASSDSIGRIVSSTLLTIVILDVPFNVGGTNDDSTISPLEATPESCFLRRKAMILPARILYTCTIDARIRLIYFARFAVPVQIL